MTVNKNQKSKPVPLSGKSISQSEYGRRKSLHTQFIHEIASLQDKTIQVIVFEFEGEAFAIEIGKIEEVVITPKITRIPKTPSYIAGIAKVRNSSIMILDLAGKLGIHPPLENLSERGKYTVVVSSERFVIGILVPEVPASQKVKGSQIHPTGLDLAGSTEDETYIKGLIELSNQQQVFFIDIDELIEGDRMEARVASEDEENRN